VDVLRVEVDAVTRTGLFERRALAKYRGLVAFLRVNVIHDELVVADVV